MREKDRELARKRRRREKRLKIKKKELLAKANTKSSKRK